MAQAPTPRAPRPPASRDDAIALISAYGAFRVLLALLTVWTFFAGFSLLTQGIGALSFGGADPAAERIIGAHMVLLAPIYGLIAWRREEYRLLVWLPYAGQLAVVLPTLYDFIISGDREIEDGALMFIVSLIFLVLMVYFWWSSHPLGFFQPAEEEAEEEELAEEDEYYDDEEEEEPEEPPPPAGPRRGAF